MLEDYIKKLERENKALNNALIKQERNYKIEIINAQLREEVKRLKQIIKEHGITNDTK